MLYSFKHIGHVNVRSPSQDESQPRHSEDVAHSARQGQSLDVRRPPRHSSSDIYWPPRRRASEPLRHTMSDGLQLDSLSRTGGLDLESSKEEEHPDAHGVSSNPLPPTAGQATFETSSGVDGCNSPTVQPSIERSDYSERPPQLPYYLWDHKLSISFFWFLILAESCFVPMSLYYGLIFGTTLRHGALFAIITSVFGFITGYEYACRGYLLLKKSPKYRPLNSSPRFWGFDTLHWLLSGPYVVMTGVLIGGSIPHEPLQRVLATPMALGFIILGVIFIVNGVAVERRWRLRYFRMSSHVKGAFTPPITYAIVEDIVAVDGGGGQTYRMALMTRYNASPVFRKLLRHMTWFWGVPSLTVGVALMALVFTMRREVAYGLGWGVPAIWAGIWSLMTILWVKRVMREEERGWKGPIWLDTAGVDGGGGCTMEMTHGQSDSRSGMAV